MGVTICNSNKPEEVAITIKLAALFFHFTATNSSFSMASSEWSGCTSALMRAAINKNSWRSDDDLTTMAASQSLTPCLCTGNAHAPWCRFVRALLVATAAALVVVVVHADEATTTTAAAGGFAAATNDHQRPKIPAIFVFGDSIVDPGNTNNRLTEARANFPPYGQDFPGGVATGRFSNGLVPGDLLGTCVG